MKRTASLWVVVRLALAWSSGASAVSITNGLVAGYDLNATPESGFWPSWYNDRLLVEPVAAVAPIRC